MLSRECSKPGARCATMGKADSIERQQGAHGGSTT
jgi:hypothetical protein